MNIDFMEYLPFFIPLIIAQVGLAIVAAIQVVKQPSFRIGNRLLWLVAVLVFSIIGPVCYFIFGKEQKR